MPDSYPDDWNARRKQVYARDNFRCQECGKRGGEHGDTVLHAHHEVPKSEGGTHERSNLTTLCPACHDAQHEHRILGAESDSERATQSNPFGDEAWKVQVGFFGWVGSFLVLFLVFSPGTDEFWTFVLGFLLLTFGVSVTALGYQLHRNPEFDRF